MKSFCRYDNHPLIWARISHWMVEKKVRARASFTRFAGSHASDFPVYEILVKRALCVKEHQKVISCDDAPRAIIQQRKLNPRYVCFKRARASEMVRNGYTKTQHMIHQKYKSEKDYYMWVMSSSPHHIRDVSFVN